MRWKGRGMRERLARLMLKTEAQHACCRSRSRGRSRSDSNCSAAANAEVWRSMALAGDVLCK